MLTPKQIKFAVNFWADKLRTKWGDSTTEKFEKALEKTLRGEGEDDFPRSCCSHFGPHETLIKALGSTRVDRATLLKNEKGELREPPAITDDVDMIFNPDGSIDLRIEKHWEKKTEKEL